MRQLGELIASYLRKMIANCLLTGVASTTRLLLFNGLLIKQGLTQRERMVRLNQVAITQMKSLMANKTMKKLK